MSNAAPIPIPSYSGESPSIQNGGRVTREEKKALSRRRILEAARDVFFRDGFMLANLDEVAHRAGVAKGTLYRYFESKADLYVAVLAENGKRFLDKLRKDYGSVKFKAAIRAYTKANKHGIAQPPAWVRVPKRHKTHHDRGNEPWAAN